MESHIIEHGDWLLYIDAIGSFVFNRNNAERARIEYACWNRDRGAAAAVQNAAVNAATIFARVTGRRDVPFAVVDCNDPFDVAEFERQLRDRDYRTRTTAALAVHCMEGGDGDA